MEIQSPLFISRFLALRDFLYFLMFLFPFPLVCIFAAVVLKVDVFTIAPIVSMLL